MTEAYVLTPEQQELAESNLELVKIIIKVDFHTNENIRGLEFDEMYQCGCLALCKAAATYNHSTQFRTYAGRVIYNALVDQLRSSMRNHAKTLNCNAPLSDDNNDEDYTLFHKDCNEVEDNILAGDLRKMLSDSKHNHKGAVLKGIEAIELRLKGYTGAEIAEMYGVKNNNVTSWISKAQAALRSEYPEFLICQN